MKSLEILAIGIRLLGIYVLLQTLQLFAEGISAYSSILSAGVERNAGIKLSITYGVASAAYLIASILLMKFPYTIAKKLLPASTDDSPVFNGSISDLQIVGFTLLGVYILSWAVPDLVHNAGMIMLVEEDDRLFQYGSVREYWLYGVVSVLEIVIGLMLIFRSRGLSYLITRIRNAGYSTDA